MPSRLHLILILGGLTAFGPFSVDMYLPSFTALARDFDASEIAVQATLSTFLTGLALGQLVIGPLADRYGRRTPLLIGLVLYVAAAVACAFAPNIESLWVARFAQSIGACAAIVIARATVRDLYSGADGAHFLSMLMLILGMAPIVGPPLGALILDQVGWRGIFWFHTALGVAAFAAVVLVLPETLPAKSRRHGGIISVLAGYLTLLKDRRYLAPTVAADCVFAGLFAFLAAGPFVLVDVYGLTPQQFAFLFSFNAFGFVVGTQINARLVHRFGPARMLTAALVVYFAAAVVMLANVLSGFGGFVGLAAPLFVLFATIGAAPTNALALAQEHYPHMAGSATALFGAIQFGIGAAIGVLVGLLHDGTALPMAAIIAVAATASLIFNYWLAPGLKRLG